MKRKHVTSPTQRTQAHLREHAMLVANCERKMPATGRGWKGPLVTQDLFGVFDTLALNPTAENDVLAIQSTTGDHHAERVKKVVRHPQIETLLRHFRIEIWSWSKRGAEGERKLWTLRRERVGLSTKGKVIVTQSFDPLY